MEKIKFDELEKKSNMIGMLYKRSKIKVICGVDDSETIKLTLHDSQHDLKFTYSGFILAVNEVLNLLPPIERKIIEVEVLENIQENPFWYLGLLSRSSYYRYRKEAYKTFLSYFD